MTDTAHEASTAAPVTSAASTSTAPKPAAAPKRKSKSRRKTRRRDGSDSDASSDGSASDAATAAAAAGPKSAKAKGKAKQQPQQPQQPKPLFPEASHTTPLVWADADVSQNEIVSFDFGDNSSKSTKPAKPQREFTEEQRKRHEEKLRVKKEKQKAKRKAAKEAKMKEKEGAAVKDSKPKDAAGADKADAAPKVQQANKVDASLAASTSALKLDDPEPAPSPLPTSTPASAPATSPPTSAPTAATTTTAPAVRPNQPFAHRPLRERLSNPNENRFGPRPPHWANDQRQNVRPMPDFWRGRGGPRGIPRGAFRGFPRGRGRGGFGPFGPGGPHFRPPFRPQGPPHGPPNAASAAVANNSPNAPPANAPSAPRAMLEASGSGSTPAPAASSEQPETSEPAQPTEAEPTEKTAPAQQPQQQAAAQPAVPPHQARFRPNMPRPDGRWGHDGFHQHMREDAFRANRGMRARGRGRGFGPRGGFRPFFNHPGHLPTPEVSPDRAEKPAAKPTESASIEALLDDSGAVTVRLPGETEAVAVDTRVDTRPPLQPIELASQSQSPLPPAFTPSNPSPGPYSDAGSMSSSGYVGPIPPEYYGGVPTFRPPPNAMYGRPSFGQSFTPEPFQPGHASHPSHASRGSFSGPGAFFSQSPMPGMDPRAGSPFNPYAPGFVMPAVSGMKAEVRTGLEEAPKSPHSEGTDSMPGQIQTPEGFVGMAPGYYAYNPYADGQVFYPPPQGYWPPQGFEQGMYGYEGEFQPQHQPQHHHQHQAQGQHHGGF